MTVVIAVGLLDGKLFTVKKDEGRSHVIRKIAYAHLYGDKLHGDIVADFNDGSRKVSDLICGKSAVGGNYNSMRDTYSSALICDKFAEDMCMHLSRNAENCVQRV